MKPDGPETYSIISVPLATQKEYRKEQRNGAAVVAWKKADIDSKIQEYKSEYERLSWKLDTAIAANVDDLNDRHRIRELRFKIDCMEAIRYPDPPQNPKGRTGRKRRPALNEFIACAGPLWKKACAEYGRVNHETLKTICGALDAHGFTLKECLGQRWRVVAYLNSKAGTPKIIRTWVDAIACKKAGPMPNAMATRTLTPNRAVRLALSDAARHCGDVAI